jgi:hypothetical protein
MFIIFGPAPQGEETIRNMAPRFPRLNTKNPTVSVRSVVDLRLLLIYFHCFRPSLGSLATVFAPSDTRPRFTTPYRRRAPPAPQ